MIHLEPPHRGCAEKEGAEECGTDDDVAEPAAMVLGRLSRLRIWLWRPGYGWPELKSLAADGAAVEGTFRSGKPDVGAGTGRTKNLASCHRGNPLHVLGKGSCDGCLSLTNATQRGHGCPFRAMGHSSGIGILLNRVNRRTGTVTGRGVPVKAGLTLPSSSWYCKLIVEPTKNRLKTLARRRGGRSARAGLRVS